MQLSSEQHGSTQIVKIEEARIDAMAAIGFKDTVRGVTGDQTDRLVLDLNKVEFIDSSGLGAIVALMKLLAPGCKLELAGLTSTVQKVFRLTRMDTIFTLYDNAADSLHDPAV